MAVPNVVIFEGDLEEGELEIGQVSALLHGKGVQSVASVMARVGGGEQKGVGENAGIGSLTIPVFWYHITLKKNIPEITGNNSFFSFQLITFYPLGILVVSFAIFPLVVELLVPLLLVVALPVAIFVTLLPVVCTAGCSSQWNGSKLLFGSTQDGFLEA